MEKKHEVPRLMKWRTATASESLTSRGAGFHRKICANCGKPFSVPVDGVNKVATPLYQNGREIPAMWYARIPFSNVGYEDKGGRPVKAEYETPGKMTKFHAAAHFERILGSMVKIARMFRKVPIADSITDCRACHRNLVTDKAQAWRHESIIVVKRDKKGKIVDTREIRVNGNKPLPPELSDAKLPRQQRTASITRSTAEEKRCIWYCTFPSTRGDRGYTMKTDKELTEKEAREWFRIHSGRGTLSGCSVYPSII